MFEIIFRPEFAHVAPQLLETLAPILVGYILYIKYHKHKNRNLGQDRTKERRNKKRVAVHTDGRRDRRGGHK